jgi:ABC-type glycerol-3-phosphate transport system substrate-binding protein
MSNPNTNYSNMPSPDLGSPQPAPYYYEQPQQPYQEVTTTTTTTTEVVKPDNRRRFLIIGLIVFGLILLLLLVLSLASRGGTGSTTTPTARNVSLQFRGAFLPSEAIQPLIDEYQTLNPTIKIEYADKWPEGAYKDASQIYKSEINRVLRENDSVNIPDIYMVNNSWAGDYEKYSKASNNLDFQTFNSIFYPAAATDFAADGKNVYGVPLWMDTLAILYNKDILSSKSILEPSTNWVEFKRQAQTLTTKEGATIKVAGFAAGNLENVSYGFELANILLLQNGVEMLNAQKQPTFGTFSEAVPAIQYFQSFVRDSNSTWNATMQNDSAAFLESKVAMIAAPSYRYRDILKYNQGYNINLNIGVSQIPQITGQSQEIINFADYWGAMVSDARGNSTFAWDFLKWLTQPEQLRKLSDNVATSTSSFGLLYPRRDMAQILQTDPDLAVYNESLPFAQSWYMVNGTKVREEFATILNSGGINASQVTQLQTNVQTVITNKGQI